MPNVMGRVFPYTPEGMAAAEDYRSSMGMRGGGMMGFRPVGYQDGDLVDEELNIVEQLRNRFYELREGGGYPDGSYGSYGSLESETVW